MVLSRGSATGTVATLTWHYGGTMVALCQLSIMVVQKHNTIIILSLSSFHNNHGVITLRCTSVSLCLNHPMISEILVAGVFEKSRSVNHH